jgi:formylglycine-generating enzyme required for sulfatase activity
MAYLRELLRSCLHWQTSDQALDAYLLSDERLRAGDLALLFDGLDEMGWAGAGTFLEALYALNRDFPKTRTVVTGRPLAWQDRSLPEFYQYFELLELGDEAVGAYLEKRLGANSSAAHLVRRTLAESERLVELGRNPLLLSMICTSLERSHGSDPIQNRSDLYRECTDVLLGRLYAHGPSSPSELDRDATLAVLKDVAYRFFLWQEPDFPAPQVQLMASAVVPRTAVEQIVDMLDIVERRCGLVQRSGETYCFVHRSLWEYFTALAFVDKNVSALVHQAANPQWEEVVRLNIGLRARERPREPLEQLVRQLWIVNRPLCVRAASEVDEATRIVRSLISQQDENTERLLLIDALDQSLELLPRTQWKRVVYETLLTLFVTCGERNCEVLYRTERLLTLRGFEPLEPGGFIYELLDLAGAPARHAVACADAANCLEWIAVEGGLGYLGHDKNGHDNEKPKRLFRFANFEMAKHPVTVRLGRDFKWGLGAQAGRSRPGESNTPMTQVTWYEGYYLAMWLDCRLPTEEQWEYAARGGQLAAGHYLWFHGDDVAALSDSAWFGEAQRSKPHHVSETDGQGRERNRNPLGLTNMLGNIWEWTRTSYRDGTYIEQDGGETRRPIQVVKGERTMRGGTFKGSPDSVRCGRRVPANPTNRGSTVGFRLVRGRQHRGDEPEQEEVKP